MPILKKMLQELQPHDGEDDIADINKIRKDFSIFFIVLMIVLSLYIQGYVFIHLLDLNSSQINIIDNTFDVLLIIIIMYFLFKYKSSLSDFGVTFKNSKKSLIESTFLTLFFVIILTAIKIYLIGNVSIFSGRSVLEWKFVKWDYYTYVIVAPLQEFICRGFIQTIIYRFLVGKYKGLWAVLVTSLLFGLFHIHISLALCITTIIAGILLGLMYLRHQNLIGVSLFHFIVGNWLGILGFWDIITKNNFNL